MISEYFRQTRRNWQVELQHKNFKETLIIGMVILIIILSFLTPFFHFIEKRHGIILNDWLLNQIPPSNVSIPIFACVWSCALLMLITALKDPDILIHFLYAYILLSVIRCSCIYLVPLNTPPALVVLVDPLANSFYGATFITKDLFFSGHTSTLFLMFLCHHSKAKKVYTLSASIIVAVLVLVQHIHYTIDVVFAFPITFVCYKIAAIYVHRKLF